MYSTIFATTLLGALGVSATNFTVKVGDGGLMFNPSTVENAQVGDTIAFQFVAKNHSVTQSTFLAPCTRMSTPMQGIDSGFFNVEASATTFPEWSFTLNNASAPLWFFCAQTAPVNHCQNGMVFAVNPTVEKSFNAFQNAAKSTNPGNDTATPPAGSAPLAGATSTGAPVALSSIISGAPTSASDTASGSPTSTGQAAPAQSSSSAAGTGGKGAGILVAAGIAAGLLW